MAFRHKSTTNLPFTVTQLQKNNNTSMTMCCVTLPRRAPRPAHPICPRRIDWSARPRSNIGPHFSLSSPLPNKIFHSFHSSFCNDLIGKNMHCTTITNVITRQKKKLSHKHTRARIENTTFVALANIFARFGIISRN